MNKRNPSTSLSLALSISLASGVLAAPAWSAEVTFPTDAYTTGDTLTASGLNEKFNEIKAGVNDNNSKADTNATSISTNATDIGANASDISELYNRTTSATPDVGDMQYWDGTNWVLVPAPDTDGDATLKFNKGRPVWKTATYNIGDFGPAGGIVFYITDGGVHGLEAAPTDHPTSVKWQCWDVITGADGTAIGTGAQNTADIIAAECADGSPAADVADSYTLNGYDDWFLPSKDELNQLYLQKDVVGGFTYGVYDVYVSSSEYDSRFVWLQNFNHDTTFQIINEKLATYLVRAIRAF